MSARRRTTRLAALSLQAAGFTLAELLVVIGVILVVVAATVPSFARLIESASYSTAVNRTVAALGSARAIAMQRNLQTAVAFMFDTRTELYTLVILEAADLGTGAALTDQPTTYLAPAYATAYRPARGTEVVELPKGTAIFGLPEKIANTFGGPGDPLTPQYEGQIDERPTYNWYAGVTFLDPDDASITVIPWIFPRNDPRLFWELSPNTIAPELDDPWSQLVAQGSGASQEVVRALRHANTFMVQFGPNGDVIAANALGAGQANYNAYIEYPDLPVDRGANVAAGEEVPPPYDQLTVFDPEFVDSTVIRPERNPEVLLRQANQLAIVSLSRLERGTGVARPWFLHESTSLAPWPQYRLFDGSLLDPTDPQLDVLTRDLSAWIDRNAEIVAFDRFTGSILRRTAQ